jgi:glycerol-3-phosphate O-acyltransferase
VRDRALTLGQVRQVLEPLRDYLAERGLPRTDDALRSGAGVRRVLGALARQRVVTVYDGGEEPVYAIEQGQHLVAAFYRNSAIHHFVDRAVAELVLLSPPADRWDEAMRLRDQLKFEFFFPDKQAYREQLSAELARLDPGWESADGRAVLGRSRLLMAHRVLRSFLDAQLVVAERLGAHDPARPVEETEFLAECGGVGRQMLLQGRLHGPESLSREAGRQPGPDRPGRHGADPAQAGVRRAATRCRRAGDHYRRDRCGVAAGGGRCRTLGSEPAGRGRKSN